MPTWAMLIAIVGWIIGGATIGALRTARRDTRA
jgi:hypothetical protein